MKQITGILSTPAQTFQTKLADGSILRFELVFRPRIPAFFINVSWKNFAINGLKLCQNINLLWQFRNLPFGICINLNDGTEPYLVDDFTTGRAQFIILDRVDLDYITSLTGGVN